jgi:hypothetical protein
MPIALSIDMSAVAAFPSAESKDFLLAETMLVVFNALDVVLTVVWLCTGAACEANPLLRVAWQLSPAAFVAVKTGLIHGGALLLHRHRHLGAARAAMFAASGVYALVVAWHLLHLPMLYS